jgi:isoquinoline 1-oxidoreductase beta subunit
VGLKTGALRAPYSNSTAWVIQSFIDELAHAAGKDPVQFRLDLLAAPQVTPLRLPDVRRAAGIGCRADDRRGETGCGKIRLGQTPVAERHSAGVAFHFSHRGYFAEVAEVSVQRNKKSK